MEANNLAWSGFAPKTKPNRTGSRYHNISVLYWYFETSSKYPCNKAHPDQSNALLQYRLSPKNFHIPHRADLAVCAHIEAYCIFRKDGLSPTPPALPHSCLHLTKRFIQATDAAHRLHRPRLWLQHQRPSSPNACTSSLIASAASTLARQASSASMLLSLSFSQRDIQRIGFGRATTAVELVPAAGGPCWSAFCSLRRRLRSSALKFHSPGTRA